MINAYDFDGTIYKGDATIGFYLFSLKKDPKLIRFLPIQVYGFLVYMVGLKNKEYLKEHFFSFLKGIKDVDHYISEFWDKNQKKIKTWYLDQQEKTDLIISASPEFLLKPLEKNFKFKVIASKVNKKTGEFESKNCYGEEKVKRFHQEIKNNKIKKFYSDSMSDKPMMDIAEKAFYVKKNKIHELTNIK